MRSTTLNYLLKRFNLFRYRVADGGFYRGTAVFCIAAFTLNPLSFLFSSTDVFCSLWDYHPNGSFKVGQVMRPNQKSRI
jgi:hypothetical protein